MLLAESLLIMQEVSIPVWLLPQNTSHEVVSLMHRLFPAFMSGCRCVIGAFVVDVKGRRVEALQEALLATKMLHSKFMTVAQEYTDKIADAVRKQKGDAPDKSEAVGTMAAALRIAQSRVDKNIVKAVQDKHALIREPGQLRKQERSGKAFELFRNLALYLLARFVLVKSSKAANQ